jgi:hypothetical protein
MSELKQSKIAASYIDQGYTEHYNPIDMEVVGETPCECGTGMTYIGLKRDKSYIAIALCTSCGIEYEF